CELKTGGGVDRRGFGQRLPRYCRLQLDQKALHFANDTRGNRLNLPVEPAEEKNMLIELLFQCGRDRRAKYLAQTGDCACDAGDEMIALLRHRLKIVAADVIEV